MQCWTALYGVIVVLLLWLLLLLSWLSRAGFSFSMRSAHFTLLPNCQLDRHKSKSRKCRCLDNRPLCCGRVCVVWCIGCVCSHCAHNILFNAHFVHNLLLMNASAMLCCLAACLPVSLVGYLLAWLAVSCHRFAANCAHK